jgi:hypothetical protein
MIALAGIVALCVLILPVAQVGGAIAGITNASININNWRVRGCPERWFEDDKIHYRCKPPSRVK